MITTLFCPRFTSWNFHIREKTCRVINGTVKPKTRPWHGQKKRGYIFQHHHFCYPQEVQDQTKWLVFRMIHGFRIPDPTNGQSLVDLDFQGISLCWIFGGGATFLLSMGDLTPGKSTAVLLNSFCSGYKKSHFTTLEKQKKHVSSSPEIFRAAKCWQTEIKGYIN